MFEGPGGGVELSLSTLVVEGGKVLEAVREVNGTMAVEGVALPPPPSSGSSTSTSCCRDNCAMMLSPATSNEMCVRYEGMTSPTLISSSSMALRCR